MARRIVSKWSTRSPSLTFSRMRSSSSCSSAGIRIEIGLPVLWLRFAPETSLPEPLATIATVSKSRDDELQGRLQGFDRIEPASGALPPTATAAVVF